MSSYIKIDSALRTNPLTTLPSDCTILSKDGLRAGRYQLKSCFLPITYYNVGATNNVIYFTDTTGAHVATITTGQYTLATVLPAIVTAINAVGNGTATVTVNSLTSRITIAYTELFSLTFGTNTANSAATMMGFANSNTASATSQTGTMIANMSTLKSYNFQISDCSPGVHTMNGNSYTFVIPALSLTPSIEYYEPPVQFPITIQLEKSTSSLKFAIYDDNHEIINNMSADWFMMLEKL